MKKIRTVLLSGTAAMLVVLAGCGGGGGSGAGTAPVPAPAKQGFVAKTVRIVIPGKKSQARNAKYVSSSSQGVGVSFGPSPFKFPSQSTPTAAFDISTGSTLCQPDAQTGGRTCTVTVQATVGASYDFQVTVWDTTPSNGGFPSGNILSTVTSLGQTIASGSAPSISVSLNGVIASFSTTVSPQTITASQSGGATATVSVNALDTDGNIVMGTGNWIDANGNPLTVSVASTATSNGGAIKTAPASPAPVTASSPNVTVTYSGGSSWGTVFTPTVTPATGTFSGAVAGATLAITPTINLYPIPLPSSSGTPPSPAPWRITGATDGNLYFTESGSQQLGQLNPATGQIVQISDGGLNVNPSGITQASDGHIWFLMYNPGNNANIWWVQTGANFSDANLGGFYSGDAFGDQQDIVDGGDGCMYYTSPGTATISTETVTGQTCSNGGATFSPHTPVGIIKGPDGNIWYADSAGTIGYYPKTGGSSVMQMATVPTGTSYLTAGPDGNIWFTVPNGSYVQSITPTGTLSAQYPTPVAVGGLGGITAGPDGALWVAGGGGIARVTTAGVATAYTQGLSPTDHPFAICVGPDGNIWFTETTANTIGELIY